MNKTRLFIVDSQGNKITPLEAASIFGKCDSWAYKAMTGDIKSLKDFVTFVNRTKKKHPKTVNVLDKHGNSYSMSQVSILVNTSHSWVATKYRQGVRSLEEFMLLSEQIRCRKQNSKEDTRIDIDSISVGSWERENELLR